MERCKIQAIQFGYLIMREVKRDKERANNLQLLDWTLEKAAREGTIVPAKTLSGIFYANLLNLSLVFELFHLTSKNRTERR